MSEAKKAVKSLLGDRYGKISVRSGRGTAHAWRHIETPIPVPLVVRNEVEAHLVQEKLCGSYQCDHGFYSACILWSTTL